MNRLPCEPVSLLLRDPTGTQKLREGRRSAGELVEFRQPVHGTSQFPGSLGHLPGRTSHLLGLLLYRPLHLRSLSALYFLTFRLPVMGDTAAGATAEAPG